MNVTREEAENCEKEVYPEIGTASSNHEHTHRRQEDGDDNEADSSDHFDIVELLEDVIVWNAKKQEAWERAIL